MTEETNETPEDVLSDEILSDARRRADRTVKRAEREGKKVIDAAVNRAEAARDHMLEMTDRRVARDEHVFTAALAQEERMRQLATQGALLAEVFEKAAGQLSARDGFDAAGLAQPFAVEAIRLMSGDAFVLRLAASDLAAMKATLADKVAAAVKAELGRDVRVTVASEPADIAGGVIVDSRDGAQQVDNSFAGRLERQKRELRFEVAERILEDAEPAKDESA